MLIRPPVVREMRRNLWADMTRTAPRPASPSVASSESDLDEADATLSRLRELGELKAAGVLTEEEFAREKARILS